VAYVKARECNAVVYLLNREREKEGSAKRAFCREKRKQTKQLNWFSLLFCLSTVTLFSSLLSDLAKTPFSITATLLSSLQDSFLFLSHFLLSLTFFSFLFRLFPGKIPSRNHCFDLSRAIQLLIALSKLPHFSSLEFPPLTEFCTAQFSGKVGVPGNGAFSRWLYRCCSNGDKKRRKWDEWTIEAVPS